MAQTFRSGTPGHDLWRAPLPAAKANKNSVQCRLVDHLQDFWMTVPPFAILLCVFLPSISGHGRLIEPPSRASAWRYGFNTPHNYNDHELYCGGYTRQWVKNSGKCGVCGDAWDTEPPRPHEYGGTYGEGVIVRKYGVASIVTIRVELTANHNGYFTFSICPDYKNATQDCLDQNILKIYRPQDNVKHQNVRYYPKDGNRVYEMKYNLPKGISCQHCILQWRYIAGNNWGSCQDGTEAVGCGPQEEFRACADITIAGKGTEVTYVPEVTTESYLPTVAPEQETFNPITSLIISIVSFLAVFLIFSLLYLHYYQFGERVKNWIKTQPCRISDCDEKGDAATEVPLPPPRSKRGNIQNDDIQRVKLRKDNLV